MSNQETNTMTNKNVGVPVPVILFFAVVALILFAVAGYYFYLTWATIYTVNGISVLEAPFFRSKAIVLAAAGIVATVADVYLVRLNKGKR
ncbi:MAG: hypothetical protein K6F75_04685 [Butyrivibrio sp.]|nr:hypothetical protein [Butyrivibrio sp.]